MFISLAWIIYARSLIVEELQAQKDKLDDNILQLGKDHLDQINALKVEHEKQISWEKEKHEDSLSNYRQLCKRIQYHMYCYMCLMFIVQSKKKKNVLIFYNINIENETPKVKSYLFHITSTSYMIFKYNYVIFELYCLDIVF